MEYAKMRGDVRKGYLLRWAELQGPTYTPLTALVRLRGVLEEVHHEAHNAVAALRYVKRVVYYVEHDDVEAWVFTPSDPPGISMRHRDVRAVEALPAARQQSILYQ